jgi:hypothetical protein
MTWIEEPDPPLSLPARILDSARRRLASGPLIADAFRIALFCLFLSAFLAPPGVRDNGGMPGRVTADIIPLARHPLNFAALHEPILARRLTLPVAAHLLHLANRGIIAIPIVCNFLTLVLLYCELTLAMNESFAFLSVMLLSLTTMTIIGNTWLGMPDPISNLLGVACMASETPALVAVYSFFGLMNDERFTLIIPFFLLWKIKDRINIGGVWRRLAPFGVSVTIAILATGLVQFLVVRDAVPLSVYRRITAEVWQQHAVYPLYVPLAIFFGFRWAWWLPVYLAGAITRTRPKILWVVVLLLIACESASAMAVGDMTRSMGQVFPGFILVIYALYKLRPDVLLRWLPVTILAMAITPMLDFSAIYCFPRYSIPVILIRRLWAHL